MPRISALCLTVLALAAPTVSAQTPDAPPNAAVQDAPTARPGDARKTIGTDTSAPTVAYQGTLSDGGAPVADGSYTVAVGLFGDATGGAAQYAETHTVTTVGGAFALAIGGGTPTAGSFGSVTFADETWVEVAVGGTTLGPRTLLLAVPHARSLTAGAEVSGVVSGGAAFRAVNTSPSGLSAAVEALSESTEGAGVFGEVSAPSGTTYGVYGLSTSTSGRGVYGRTTTTTGTTFGVHGLSASASGLGVYGQATASTGFNYGVYGLSASTNGRGVFGQAFSSTGGAYGVYGLSQSTSGRGVFGNASTSTGATYGVYGLNASTSGRAVYGWASAATGITYGVWGQVSSPDGYAAHFSGGQGVFSDAQVRVQSDGTNTRPQLVLQEADAADFARIDFRNGNASGHTWTVAAGGPGAGTFNLFTRGRDVVQFKADADDGGTDPNLIVTSAGGAALTQGGVWTNASSRALKTEFLPVDGAAVLDALAGVEVTTWRYHAEGEGIRHLGPMSQDFYAAFGLGASDETIGTADADGVALAAVKSLHDLAQRQAAEIEAQRAEIGALRTDRDRQQAELDALRAEVQAIRDALAPRAVR